MEIGGLIFTKKCGAVALFSILTIDFKLLTRFINSISLDLDKRFLYKRRIMSWKHKINIGLFTGL
jgi:hypothetical protein